MSRAAAAAAAPTSAASAAAARQPARQSSWGGGGGDSDEEKESHAYGAAGAAAAAAAAADDDEVDDNETLATTVHGGMGATVILGGERKLKVDQVPFSIVCTLMERVLGAKRLQKERLMTNFWKMVYQPNVSLFPLMRLLLPQLDSERSTYGLRESSLGDVYIQALGLSKTLDQAMRLKSYKTPHRAGAGAAGGHSSAGSVSGEFSLVLADVLRHYVSVREGESKLTIADVNGLLDQLAQEREKGSAARAGVFMRLVTELSPKENMWFARVILKDLKIGMKHESMLKLFDSDALDMYNACSSLKNVCENVAQPTRTKAAFEAVQYFSACKPMLASSPAWDQVVAKMKGHGFFIEDKYDGERIIIHKKDGVVKLFTRKSIDYTNRYGYGSTFTPVVLQALPKDCIVDGELVTFDTATGQYLKFGSNRTIALAGVGATGGDTKQLCYIAFDILKVEDRLLLNRPLNQRRAILKSLVIPQSRKFEVIEHRTDVTTSQGLLAALTEATGMGKEGIIVKDITAPYVLNDRSDWWIKVKPDYVEGLRDNMDLILMGGYYGEGTRRSGGISHFLLGLHERRLSMDETKAYEQDRRKLPPKLFAFCKVGSGYSIDRLKALRKELEHKWQVYDPHRQPPHFMGWQHERSDIPDVWIDPRDSVCFEIKAYEITACRPNKFSAGYTCRFPRVVQIRDDKGWSDCMTRDDMLKLAEPALRQSAGALLAAAEEDDLSRKRLDVGAAEGGPAAAGAKMEEGLSLEELLSQVKDEPDRGDDWLAQDRQREAARLSQAQNLVSPPPAAAPREIEGLDAHMQGDGAGAVEVGAIYADGAGDWRQGDAENVWNAADHAGMDAAAAAAAAGDGGGGKKGKKRKAKADTGAKKLAIKKGTVLSLFQPTDVSNCVLLSQLFENKSFCVMSTDKSPSKADLERTIALHGGTFTQNCMPITFCILAKWDDTIKVAVQKKARNKDIIHYQWLLDCVAQQRLLPFGSRYVIQGTEATSRALAREVDPYGDSFTLDADRASLEMALQELSAKQPHPFEAPLPGASPEPPSHAHRALSGGKHAHSAIPSTLQLHQARPAPQGYRSAFLSFTPEQQAALSSPVRAFIGFEVFIYGPQESVSIKLCVLTLQLLGARVTDVLSTSLTHVLHTQEDAFYTREALVACMTGIGLTLDDGSASSAAPAASAAASARATRCKLITPEWVEEQRRMHTEALTHMAADDAAPDAAAAAAPAMVD